VIESARLLFSAALRSDARPIRPNRLLEILHFMAYTGPKKFWRKPTAIKMGRSLATFIRYVFYRETSFREDAPARGDRRGYTLIEVIVSITIFAIVLITAFDGFGMIGKLRYQVEAEIDLNKDVYESIETLVTMIKEGGHIDYEEYFGRKAIGYSMTAGHYAGLTGFGNYGSGGSVGSSSYGNWHYYCTSSTGGVNMGTNGCMVSGVPQRFGEYELQFVDYNANADDDPADCFIRGIPGAQPGDEDCDGNVRFDDDDEVIGRGPTVFTGGTALKELYLVKTKPSAERIFFRRIVRLDPAVAGNPNFPCDLTTGSGAGCIGNVQILRMRGRDLGKTHSATGQTVGLYDGLIDTWLCHEDYRCANPSDVASGVDSEWVDLFPSGVNVLDLDFFISPNKNPEYAWRENTDDIKASESVGIVITIGHSWERRKRIKTSNPSVRVSTTVNLISD
jgi:prepilin-type N-terminal cleavage/methylation domain-containing protein